jgi:hypothetical protein
MENCDGVSQRRVLLHEKGRKNMRAFILYALNILYLYEIPFNVQPYLLARYIERQLTPISSKDPP